MWCCAPLQGHGDQCAIVQENGCATVQPEFYSTAQGPGCRTMQPYGTVQSDAYGKCAETFMGSSVQLICMGQFRDLNSGS